MTKPLSEQVAELEADHARLGRKMFRLEAERNDLQRQLQEARDEAAELRAGQGRWPGDRDDRLTDSEQQQISTYLRMVSHSFFNPARYRRRDGTFEDAIIEQLDAEVAQWRQPTPRLTVHDLEVAPVGSVLRFGYLERTKGPYGLWIADTGATFSNKGMIERGFEDATLTTPEAQ